MKDFNEIFNYDPDTGSITYKVKLKHRSKGIGDDATTAASKGYRKIWIYGKHYPAHRMAWYLHYGKFPELDIDHIDRDPSNNRITNLRDVNRSVNSLNRGVKSTNSTGITGVSIHKQHKLKYQINYKGKYIGVSHDFFEACCIRKSTEAINE